MEGFFTSFTLPRIRFVPHVYEYRLVKNKDYKIQLAINYISKNTFKEYLSDEEYKKLINNKYFLGEKIFSNKVSFKY